MEIKLNGYQQKTQRMIALWQQVVRDYNNGDTAEIIAKRYKRTRGWVYWVFKRLSELDITN